MSLKVVLCGGTDVGKSGLIIKLITDQFMAQYDPTLDGDQYKKTLSVDDEKIILDILDTAGDVQFASMQQFWFREGEIFIIVYSIASKISFDQTKHFINKIASAQKIKIPKLRNGSKSNLNSETNSEERPFVIVGNKCDLEEQREVPYGDGEELAKKLNCPFFECSAFKQINLTEMWSEAVRLNKRLHAKQNISINIENKLEKKDVNQNDEDNDNDNNKFLCCSKENDDKKIKKVTDNVQFYAVKKLPSDDLSLPILALKNFQVSRQFNSKRFTIAIISGLFLPFVLIFQTIAFLLYSENKNAWYYPDNYQYDVVHYSILLDYLGLIVGRQPGQDPQTVKDKKWFLRQNPRQKVVRVFLCLLMMLAFTIFFFNITRYNYPNSSLQETVGPLVLFWLLWFLLSSWIAFEIQITPKLPPLLLSRLRRVTLIFGEHFTHSTSAFKFLRSYSIARNDNSFLSLFQYILIFSLSALYALIPGLTRVTVGDNSDEITEKVFVYAWKVEIGAMLVNFLFMTIFILSVEIQYTKHFDKYRHWMRDLTLLLSKETLNDNRDNNLNGTADPTRNRGESQTLRDIQEMIEIEKSQNINPLKFGHEFSKHLFLSLTRRSNALGWLEIRSFLAIEGKLLFGEQELPTLFLMIVTLSLSFFIFYRVFFIPGSPIMSILFNSNCILMIICLISLIRITVTGYQFKNLQEMQERLLGEQKLWMRCNVASSIGVETIQVKLASFSEIEHNKSPSMITTINPLAKVEVNKNALKADIVRLVSASNDDQMDDNDNEDNKEEEKEEKEEKMNDNDKVEELEVVENKYGNDKSEPLLTPKTTITNPKKKVNFTKNNTKEMEEEKHKMEKEMEMKMAMQTNSILSRVDTTNWYQYNFGFLDDMLFIVRKKDIYPRLFKIKLNSVLAKAIAGIIVSIVITAGKVFFF